MRAKNCGMLQASPAWGLLSPEVQRAVVSAAQTEGDDVTPFCATARRAVGWYANMAANMLGHTNAAKCRAAAMAQANRAAMWAIGSRYVYGPHHGANMVWHLERCAHLLSLANIA